MPVQKQVVHMFLRSLNVRDVETQSEEITKMYRVDIKDTDSDNHLYEFSLMFMYSHFGTQVEGTIEATILAQSTDNINVLEELKSNANSYALPLFAKASQLIANITQERGAFPVIVPLDIWFQE